MRRSAVLAATLALCSCRSELAPPVRTLNPGYDRTTSHVLIREVVLPTRANLDYAAWNANLFLVDTARVEVHPAVVTPESLLAGGLFADICTSLDETPLSDSERISPLAWKPVEDQWLAWSFDSTGPLVSKVQEFAGRKWGDTSGAWQAFQQIVALHLHRGPDGDQAWVRIEFAPWMTPHLKGIVDQDGDGHAEAWARLASPSPSPYMLRMLRGEYTSRVLSRPEVVQWANELAALWYPVYFTDMIDLSAENAFPQSSTESNVMKELGDLRIAQPVAVMRGRPFGTPLYLVLRVPQDDSVRLVVRGDSTAETRKLDPGTPARLDSIRRGLEAERASHGGSWEAWVEQASAVRARAAALEAAMPAQVQATAVGGGTLLFRRELSYLQAGALDSLPAASNPVGRIKALRDSLAGLGIDFLFVPVPTKLDVDPTLLGGGKGLVAQPWARKLLDDLAAAGVETVDLLPSLRGRGLWRRQDTHWKPEGAEAAAERVAQRIRQYPWYSAVSRDSLLLARLDTSWTDFGDLRDRLAPEPKARVAQETVQGACFRGPDGKPWDDAETGPVLLLGDSYLGVYQKVPPRAAGFSSHLASQLKIPVSVVMGWGGGPEAPRKLAARGPHALDGRRLVVWIMSVRDLYRFPGGW